MNATPHLAAVLVVDDQLSIREALALLFELNGIPCLVADSPTAALDLMARHPIGAVIQDMNYRDNATSGIEGIELFRALKRINPDLPVVLMTAWTSNETAAALLDEGASDYIAKPWDDDRLLDTVAGLLERKSQ